MSRLEYRSRRIAALPPLSGETTSFDNCRSSDKRRTQLSTLASAVSLYICNQTNIADKHTVRSCVFATRNILA